MSPELTNALIFMLYFTFLFILTGVFNLNKKNRQKQVLLPVVTFIYGLVALFWGIPKLLEIYHESFSGFESIMSLFGLQMPGKENTILIVGFNWVVMICYLGLKVVLLPIVYFLGRPGWFVEKIYMYFYHRVKDNWFNEKTDQYVWILKKDFFQSKFFLIGFYIASLLVCYVLLFWAQMSPESELLQRTTLCLPVFALLVLGEIVWFLNGLSRPQRKKTEVLAPVENVRRLDFMREKLTDLFGSSVLYDNCYHSGRNQSESLSLVEKMESSDDEDDRLIAGYFKNIQDRQLDSNYIVFSRQLMHGKSVLINSPFYRDLTDYIMLPILRYLLRKRKCLIISGRESVTDDVKNWMQEGIRNLIDTDSLWEAEFLTPLQTKAEIGILRFCDIYEQRIFAENQDFLDDVGIVVLLEPSRMLATGQMGLSMVVNRCGRDRHDVVCCACDRNCDGLVDVLSHTLKMNFTEVTATLANRSANNSHMYWDVDCGYLHHVILPNVSHYLGVGVEIAAVAAKNKIHSLKWLSCDKFPIFDMKWIAEQYYSQICQYAGLPESQEAFSDYLNVDANLWNIRRKPELFLIIEDEFRNLFELTRIFDSRAIEEGFVNILSEQYFLRDYMIDNVRIFASDPKAIPAIVPDFARTERNTVLKIIMMMMTMPVRKSYVAHEFEMCGIETQDVDRKLRELIEIYCGLNSDTLYSVQINEHLSADSLERKIEEYYQLSEKDALYKYSQRLKTSYYITEDENGDKYHIGAKLYGHVYQSFLPGQYITISGKYYQIQQISDKGVVVRRAADHLTQRYYYRQIRSIAISNWKADDHIGSEYTFGHLETVRGSLNFHINTYGYLEMKSPADFKSAKCIEIGQIPQRQYIRKNALRIRLKGASESVRYTICVLLNEIFRTTYPDASDYIFAITYVSSCSASLTRYLLYAFEGEIEEDCIYILEDSEIDLGISVSVERNLKRYMEIIADVLIWHSEKVSGKLPRPQDFRLVQQVENFTKKHQPVAPPSNSLKRKWDDLLGAKPPEAEIQEQQKPTKLYVEESEIIYTSNYAQFSYLNFGGSTIDPYIDVENTISWLVLDRFDDNPLRRARNHGVIEPLGQTDELEFYPGTESEDLRKVIPSVDENTDDGDRPDDASHPVQVNVAEEADSFGSDENSVKTVVNHAAVLVSYGKTEQEPQVVPKTTVAPESISTPETQAKQVESQNPLGSALLSKHVNPAQIAETLTAIPVPFTETETQPAKASISSKSHPAIELAKPEYKDPTVEITRPLATSEENTQEPTRTGKSGPYHLEDKNTQKPARTGKSGPYHLEDEDSQAVTPTVETYPSLSNHGSGARKLLSQEYVKEQIKAFEGLFASDQDKNEPVVEPDTVKLPLRQLSEQTDQTLSSPSEEEENMYDDIFESFDLSEQLADPEEMLGDDSSRDGSLQAIDDFFDLKMSNEPVISSEDRSITPRDSSIRDNSLQAIDNFFDLKMSNEPVISSEDRSITPRDGSIRDNSLQAIDNFFDLKMGGESSVQTEDRTTSPRDGSLQAIDDFFDLKMGNRTKSGEHETNDDSDTMMDNRFV